MAVTALLCLALLVLAGVSEARVVVLTDENFEHLTQAASGSTTGDWFIKFYAPWCGHCKRLAPVWDELGEELKNELNVAKVDCTQNSAVCTRFSVRGYPTLLFFRRGNVYTYRGPRDVKTMAEYARGDLDRGGEAVPAEPSVVETLVSKLEAQIQSVNLHKNPVVNAVIIGGLIAAGLVIPLLLLSCLIQAVFDSSSRKHKAHAPTGTAAGAGGAGAAGAGEGVPQTNEQAKKQE